MRRVLPLLLLCSLLAGCSTARQSAADAPRSSNVAMVRSLYDAFGRGDIPAVLGMFDPGIEWMEAEHIGDSYRNRYSGPQAVAEGVFMRIGQDWSNFRVNTEKFVDGGDTIVTLGRYKATHKATGQPLDAQFVHVWTIRDGKIVRFQQYADTAQFARVTGAWK